MKLKNLHSIDEEQELGLGVRVLGCLSICLFALLLCFSFLGGGGATRDASCELKELIYVGNVIN